MTTNLTFPNSSNLASAEHDAASGTLTVTFKSGATWAYAGVGEDTVRALGAAKSAGSFFHREIRDRYPGRAVTGGR